MRYLKHLYGIFEDWPLAMAAYNCGERRVQEAMNTARGKGLKPHFWNLDLPRETEHYVPSIIAQAILYNQRERYRFAHLKTAKPMDEEDTSFALLTRPYPGLFMLLDPAVAMAVILVVSFGNYR